MIHLITGYAGYEHIQSEDEGAYNASFFGDGQYVMQEGSQFEGSILDNNTVRILDGNLLMYGRHIRIARGTYEDLIIQTGTAGKNRIDLICMTYAKNDSNGTEQAYLQVIKGIETAGTAVVPVYTDGNILEGAILNNMPLYKVVIEGIYLKELVPMFTVIPTYKTLAEQYAAQFEATIKDLKDADILDTMEEIEANTQANMFAGALSLKEHITDKNNPHGVTKSQVGLGNVPNVATNDQTPTFSTASTLVNITSGEKLSVSFGKIAKAIADLISHIGNKSNPHAVTKSQVGLGNVDNTADSAKSVKYAATATSAGSLTTARNFRTNLGKTSTASFNGTADCDPGVIGTLGLGNGGTGATNASSARTNLGLGSASVKNATTSVTRGSGDLITSGGVYTKLADYPTNSGVKSQIATCMPLTGGTFTGNVTMGGSSLLKFKSDADLQAESYVYVASGGASCGMDVAGTYKFTSESFIPAKNDSQRLGSSNYKWKQLYASTTTISTSDRNLKKDIKELTEKHKEFFMKLVPVSFGFVDGESGRTHIGFISQDVEQAMFECGMTDLDFAGFCKDVKIKIETTYEDILDEYGDKILDEKGKPKQNRIEKEVQVLDENGNPEYIYSLRYEEFIGIIAYVLQETIYELRDTKMDITELKYKLASIENTITKISA